MSIRACGACKNNSSKEILIVAYLYVDDLLFTRNSPWTNNFNDYDMPLSISLGSFENKEET